MEERVTMGEEIRAARNRARLSLSAAAGRTVFSKSSLQRIETGASTVNRSDVERLDATLGTDGELVRLFDARVRALRPPMHAFYPGVREAGHR